MTVNFIVCTFLSHPHMISLNSPTMGIYGFRLQFSVKFKNSLSQRLILFKVWIPLFCHLIHLYVIVSSRGMLSFFSWADLKVLGTLKSHFMTAFFASFLAQHNRAMYDICEQVRETAQNSMESVPQRHKVLEDNSKHVEQHLIAMVKFASWKDFDKTRKREKGDKN